MFSSQLSLLPTPRRLQLRRGTVQPRSTWAVLVPADAGRATTATAAMLADQLGCILVRVPPGRPWPTLQLAWASPGSANRLQLDRLVRKPEGYSLQITPDGVVAQALDEPGLFYASRTLAQLAQQHKALPLLRIDDWPATRLRAIHFDLKGLMPTLANLRRFIDRLAELKVNAVLVEWEDKVRFDRHPAVASPLALTKPQVRSLIRYAAARHVRLIPLQQSLGHLEYVLKHRQYARLREAGLVNEIDPLNPAAVRLINTLIDELVELHPDPDFHIGADEAWGLGTASQTRRFIARHGKHALLLNHIEKITSPLRKRGRRPLLWDDMFRSFDRRQLSQVSRLGALVYWLYRADDPHRNDQLAPMLGPYRDAGIAVIGASAVKGAGRSPHTNLPDYARRCANVDFWSAAADKYDLEGVIATAWSRYASLMPQCDPWEGAWYTYCYAAHRAWVGPRADRPQFDQAFCRLQLQLDTDPRDVVSRMHRAADNTDPNLPDELAALAEQAGSDWARHVLHYHALAARLDAWLHQAAGAAALIASRWSYLTAAHTFREIHAAARLEHLLRTAGPLAAHVQKTISRLYGSAQAREFTDSRFAAPTKLLRWARDCTVGRPSG